MRSHVLIGRFGPLDKSKVRTEPHENATEVNLVSSQKGFGYGIRDALKNLQGLRVFPTEIGFDVLVFAALIYAADTRLSRNTESQDRWTREIRLVLPVSDEARWTAVSSLLRKMLNFLTGDRWTFTFRERPRRFSRITPTRPRRFSDSFDSIALFSGGLDSLIGAVNILEHGRRPLLISHASEGAVSDAQNSCFKGLEAHYGKQALKRLRLWMNFPTTLVPDVQKEDTTRGRSFLFFALAVLAGSGFNEPSTITVPENGLIALNVPLDPLRLGSLSTRTTHPFYMARWNELLETLGIPVRLNNPYWDRSKGEMVAQCRNQVLLGSLISQSLSCSSPTKGRWRGHGIEHCGYCVPCVIRRAALDAALGRGNDPTSYTLADLTASPLDTRQSEGQQIRSFQLAIARLTADPSLAELLIHKSGPLSDETERLGSLADVYRRGMAEVANLLNHVEARPR